MSVSTERNFICGWVGGCGWCVFCCCCCCCCCCFLGCVGGGGLTSIAADVEVLLYVHRNRMLIRDGSPGRPPRLSHSSLIARCLGQFIPGHALTKLHSFSISISIKNIIIIITAILVIVIILALLSYGSKEQVAKTKIRPLV